MCQCDSLFLEIIADNELSLFEKTITKELNMNI